MHNVPLSDSAYEAYRRRAEQVGLTVEQYLDQSAPAEDFTLTPEMRAGIERGLAQADRGELVGIVQVRESLASYKTTWRERDR